MRLDKYLKVSRVIKRRTIANEVCDAKHVLVKVSEHATKDDAALMYKVID